MDRGFQHGVEAPENRHGEYHVPVLTPDVEVAEKVVGDSPDEVGNGAQLGILHLWFPLPDVLPAGTYVPQARIGCPCRACQTEATFVQGFRCSSAAHIGLGGSHDSLAAVLRLASLRLRDCRWLSAHASHLVWPGMAGLLQSRHLLASLAF